MKRYSRRNSEHWEPFSKGTESQSVSLLLLWRRLVWFQEKVRSELIVISSILQRNRLWNSQTVSEAHPTCLQIIPAASYWDYFTSRRGYTVNLFHSPPQRVAFNRSQPSTTSMSAVWGRHERTCITSPHKSQNKTRSITSLHKVLRAHERHGVLSCADSLQAISSPNKGNNWVLCSKVMMKGRCEGNEGGNEEAMVMKSILINQTLC